MRLLSQPWSGSTRQLLTRGLFAVPMQILRRDHEDGKENANLLERRKEEAALFTAK